MVDSFDANTPNRDEESAGVVSDYIKRAIAACENGDPVLGMHLYLAAFEEAVSKTTPPSDEALAGLKHAWALACKHKERSLAEYIFEKMEPFLASDEVAVCANQLQDLALDKLEEFGLSRDDLEDMAEMITHDLLGIGAQVVKVEHVIEHPLPCKKKASGEACDQTDANEDAAPVKADATATGETGAEEAQDYQSAASAEAKGEPLRSGLRQTPLQPAASPLAFFAQGLQESGFRFAQEVEVLDYSNLAGYRATVAAMREIGIGLDDDEDFQRLVGLLNDRHGLKSMPALDTLVFRAPAREDAHRFVSATLGELKLPVLRMHMEENLQGQTILCVTAQADDAEKVASLRNVFSEGGVLVLDDIDLWGVPQNEEEPGGLASLQLSRGAREAVNFIRAAVDNPDVYVFATMGATTDVDGFFLDVLEPISVVDIDYPTPEERVEVWMDIAHEHPSMRAINQSDLVRLSANMPRFDMYMAAREALEEAYKQGLSARRYVPVSRDNLFDKLAAYQPLDSAEYRELEDRVIQDFRADLENIDDILKG